MDDDDGIWIMKFYYMYTIHNLGFVSMVTARPRTLRKGSSSPGTLTKSYFRGSTVDLHVSVEPLAQGSSPGTPSRLLFSERYKTLYLSI